MRVSRFSRADGRIVGHLELPDIEGIAEKQESAEFGIWPGDVPFDHYILDGVPTPLPVEPPPTVEEPGPVYATSVDVDIERDRRVDRGFAFLGKTIQSRTGDRENIAGARQAAQDAKVIGAAAGDLGWQLLLDPEKGMAQFGWITADDSILPLDADQMIAMGTAALMHKQSLIFAGSALKRRIAGGELITDVSKDEYWNG